MSHRDTVLTLNKRRIASGGKVLERGDAVGGMGKAARPDQTGPSDTPPRFIVDKITGFLRTGPKPPKI